MLTVMHLSVSHFREGSLRLLLSVPCAVTSAAGNHLPQGCALPKAQQRIGLTGPFSCGLRMGLAEVVVRPALKPDFFYPILLLCAPFHKCWS